MLLDDSFEIEAIPPSNDAELVPMIKWHDVQLSNIWIPSELLLNRQCLSQTSSNVHQSVICRTLEKHNVVDCLSIYSEAKIEQSSFNSSEKLLDSLEELPSNYLHTEHTNLREVNEGETYSCSELPFSCLSTTESEVALDKVKNDTCLEEKVDSPDNSIADYLEHLHISDDEEENSLNGIIIEPDKPEIPISALDYTNDAKVFESCGDEIRAELVCDMPVKTDTCPLNNEMVQDSVTMSFSNSDQMEDIFEVSEKLWHDHKRNIENSSAEEGNLIFSNQTDRIRDTVECTVPEESSEFSQSPDDVSKIADCPEEKTEIHHFPFLLQKSKDKELSTVSNNGKINKKEKRSKKKASKMIPLDNFFLSKKEAADSDSEYLAFCESLRQKHGYQDTSAENKLSPIFPSLADFERTKEIEYPENSSSSITNSIFDSSSNCNVDPTFVDNDLTKYVIENIPLFVDQDMLLSLISAFGDIIIKNVVMKQSGKTLKAIITVNLEDPNWLIECLNESQPFGASDECLKCYQVL